MNSKKLYLYFTLFVATAFFSSSNLFSGVVESFSPKSKLIAKIDLDKLRNNIQYGKIKENNLNKYQIFCDSFIRETGINPEKINCIWLAGERQKQGLIVVEGDFDSVSIKNALQNKPEHEKIQKSGCLLAYICPDKHNPGMKALASLIDNKTIVIGNPTIAEDFIGNFVANTVAQDFKEKKYLQGNKFIEGIITGISEDEIQKKPFLSEIKNGYFSIDLDEKGLNMELSLNMSGQEQAEAVKNIFTGIATLQNSMKNNANRNEIGKDEFFKNLKIESSGNIISADSFISNEIIEKIIDMNAQLEKKESF